MKIVKFIELFNKLFAHYVLYSNEFFILIILINHSHELHDAKKGEFNYN